MKWSPSAVCTSSGPNDTKHAASTISCAAAPGRQGDPGSSRFYLSLEDDLMRIFGSDRISGLMQRLGMEEGVPIEHKMVTNAIARAQKQVEAQNFSVRKHLLEYDDVMNKQRESIYSLRRELLEGKDSPHGRRSRRQPRIPHDARRGVARQHGRYVRRRGRRSRRARLRCDEAGGRRNLRHRSGRAERRRPRGDASGRDHRRALGTDPPEVRERRKRWSRPTSSVASSATSCCRSSTRSGRTTSTAWIT